MAGDLYPQPLSMLWRAGVAVTGQETGLVASFHCHHCKDNRNTELFELEGTLKAM